MRVMFSYAAPSAPDYGTGAFDDQIGNTIDIAMPEGGTVAATLIAADLVDQDQTVQLTLEVDDDSPMAAAMRASRTPAESH